MLLISRCKFNFWLFSSVYSPLIATWNDAGCYADWHQRPVERTIPSSEHDPMCSPLMSIEIWFTETICVGTFDLLLMDVSTVLPWWSSKWTAPQYVPKHKNLEWTAMQLTASLLNIFCKSFDIRTYFNFGSTSSSALSVSGSYQGVATSGTRHQMTFLTNSLRLHCSPTLSMMLEKWTNRIECGEWLTSNCLSGVPQISVRNRYDFLVSNLFLLSVFDTMNGDRWDKMSINVYGLAREGVVGGDSVAAEDLVKKYNFGGQKP